MKVFVLECGDHDSLPIGVFSTAEKAIAAMAELNKKAGWERYKFDSYGTFYTEHTLDEVKEEE